MVHPEVNIRLVDTLDEVLALRPVWEQLQNHPNSDLDAYLGCNASLACVVRPYVLLLSRGAVPQAILVGRVDDTYLEAKIGYAVLHRSPVRRLTIVHAGLLGDFSEPNATAIMTALGHSLSSDKIDVLWFNSLREDSPLYAAYGRTRSFFSVDHFPETGLHWAADLSGSYAAFLNKRSSKQRKYLRHNATKVMAAYKGALEIRCHRSAGDLDKLFEDTERIASLTYHRALGVGFANTRDARHRITYALERGWFRGYILYIKGSPCAFWHGLCYGRTFFLNTTGVDPAFREFGLGIFLLNKVFEELANSGEIDTVDFGLGDAHYKRQFCDECWQEVSFYFFAHTLRGFMLNLIRTPISLADRIIRMSLEKTKLTERIKRLWRRRLQPRESGASLTEVEQ
jgi:hypothetical protein